MSRCENESAHWHICSFSHYSPYSYTKLSRVQSKKLYPKSPSEMADSLAEMADFRQGMAGFRQGMADFRQGMADFRQGMADFRQGMA
jgi:hypothetical protein